MHNEDRERRDNRPNSATQVAARSHQSAPITGRITDARLVSPHAVGMPSHTAAATVPSVKRKPVYLNRDDAVRLQLNLSDVDEVCITAAF